MLLGRQVDGLIVTGRRIEPRPSVGVGLGMPVVYAMTQSLDSDEPAILPDDYGGGRIGRGAPAGGGPAPDRAHHRARALPVRAQAGQRVLRRDRPRPTWQFSPNDVLYGEWSEAWGRQGASILLRNSPDVQAIFCGSDQIARGVSDTLRTARAPRAR